MRGRRREGRPEDRGMQDGKRGGDEDRKALAGEYICEAILVHLPHEQRDEKS